MKTLAITSVALVAATAACTKQPKSGKGCSLKVTRVLALTALLLGLAGTSAAADDISTVTWTAAGPDRTLPLGKPFYIAGPAAKDVASVQPIVVRRNHGRWRLTSDDGASCDELGTSLTGIAAATVQQWTTGRQSMQIAETAHEVLIPAPWKRAAAGDEKYKSLINGDAEFFAESYSFCLFVIAIEEKSIVNDAIAIALGDLARQLTLECPSKADPATCELSATANYDLAIANAVNPTPALQPALSAAEQLRLKTAAGKLSAAANDRPAKRKVVRDFLDAWALSLGPAAASNDGAFLGNLGIPTWLDAGASPLGIALVAALVDADGLRPDRLPAGTVIAYALKGPAVVQHVSLLDDRSRIRARGPAASPHPKAGTLVTSEPLDIRTDKLALGDGATVRDLLELPRGYIRIDDKYVAIADLKARLDPLLASAKPWTADEIAFAKQTAAQLRLLGSTVERMLLASASGSCATNWGREGVNCHLGMWLRGAIQIDGKYVSSADLKARLAPLLASAKPWTAEEIAFAKRGSAQLTVLGATEERLRQTSADGTCQSLWSRERCHLAMWQVDTTPFAILKDCGALPSALLATCAAPAAVVPAGVWPGYTNLGLEPLATLASALSTVIEQDAAWHAGVATIAITTTEHRAVTSQLAAEHLAMTQKTWFFSYVTPVTGYAYVNPGRSTSLGYLALQFHAVPNPTDVVLWTRPGDWKRAIALEVGLAPSAGSFGAEGRYDGPWSLPPLFAGVALHLIPYTSITVGGMLVDERRSVLPGEVPSLRVVRYIGLNVQINIPDLARTAFKSGVPATVQQ